MIDNIDTKNNIFLRNYSKKRERTPNWNQLEKEQLLELCRNHLTIIENKRYDALHSEEKSKVWFLIHQSFSSQFGNKRSVNRLKEQWRRMKAAARCEMQEYKRRPKTNSSTSIGVQNMPSAFCFKIYDLLDEANRLCEKETLLPTNKSEEILFPGCQKEVVKNELDDESKKSYHQVVDSQPQIDEQNNSDNISDESVEKNDSFCSSSNTSNYRTIEEPLHKDSENIKNIKFTYHDMMYEEHLMRMQIFQVQQKQLALSTELINLCTKAAKKLFRRIYISRQFQ